LCRCQVSRIWKLECGMRKIRKSAVCMQSIQSDSFCPRPSELEVLDENVRYTFENEDNMENDDEGGSSKS